MVTKGKIDCKVKSIHGNTSLATPRAVQEHDCLEGINFVRKRVVRLMIMPHSQTNTTAFIACDCLIAR